MKLFPGRKEQTINDPGREGGREDSEEGSYEEYLPAKNCPPLVARTFSSLKRNGLKTGRSYSLNRPYSDQSIGRNVRE